jgi:hypothetical protein
LATTASGSGVFGAVEISAVAGLVSVFSATVGVKISSTLLGELKAINSDLLIFDGDFNLMRTLSLELCFPLMRHPAADLQLKLASIVSPLTHLNTREPLPSA